MKKISFLLFILHFLFINAQTEFITTWKPSNVSSNILINHQNFAQSTNTQIYFPGVGSNYKIYWEEVGYPAHNGTIPSVTSNTNNPLLIDFGTPQNPTATNATYTVKVTAINFSIMVSEIGVGDHGDTAKILEINQWGNIVWSTMESAFAECKKLDVI